MKDVNFQNFQNAINSIVSGSKTSDTLIQMIGSKLNGKYPMKVLLTLEASYTRFGYVLPTMQRDLEDCFRWIDNL